MPVDNTRPLNRNSAMPLYYQLLDALQARIRAGEWRPDEILPSEADLGETYEVSRTVVRQALEGLERAGIIHRIKGKGAFLSERKVVARLLQDPAGFQANVEAQGLDVETHVLDQATVPASPDVADALRLAPGEPVVRLERLRFVEGEPVFLGTSYVPVALCGDLSEGDFSAESLNVFLGRRCGLVPAGGRRVIEAVAAGRREAELLHVQIGAPLFYLFAVTWAEDGRAMECSRVWLRGDRTVFEVQLGSEENAQEEKAGD
jgi:GntR family transcriptional regulator